MAKQPKSPASANRIASEAPGAPATGTKQTRGSGKGKPQKAAPGGRIRAWAGRFTSAPGRARRRDRAPTCHATCASPGRERNGQLTVLD